MKKTIVSALLAGAFILSIGLLAVAWTGESSDEAKADFCNSVTELNNTVTSYQGLNPLTASTEELDSAKDDIYDAYDEMIDDAEDWANAYDNPLNEWYNDLYWAYQVTSDDLTVAETVTELEDELSAFPAAFDETFDGSGCASA
jgi:hypothetical protein